MATKPAVQKTVEQYRLEVLSKMDGAYLHYTVQLSFDLFLEYVKSLHSVDANLQDFAASLKKLVKRHTGLKEFSESDVNIRFGREYSRVIYLKIRNDHIKNIVKFENDLQQTGNEFHADELSVEVNDESPIWFVYRFWWD